MPESSIQDGTDFTDTEHYRDPQRTVRMWDVLDGPGLEQKDLTIEE
jgi:hypothetical protein